MVDIAPVDDALSSSKRELNIDYEGETELFETQCEDFMSQFIEDVFSPTSPISVEDKAQFGLLCQHQEGREAFARSINQQRSNHKEVDEITFFRLVQFMATCLFECSEAGDFLPSTRLMNMCFTFHHKSPLLTGRLAEKREQYLYEFLKEQPIWQNERFWNAAFLFAVHMDRSKRSDSTSEWSNKLDVEKQKDIETCEVNSSFAHLASFLYMMKSLGIDNSQRANFLHKMSTIADLDEEQIHQLEESAEFI